MKRHKWAAMMTSLILLGSVAMGCTSNGGSQPTASPNGQESANKAVNGKFEPPVTITTARVVGSDYVFINGETIQDNVHNRWAKDKLASRSKTYSTGKIIKSASSMFAIVLMKLSWSK